MPLMWSRWSLRLATSSSSAALSGSSSGARVVLARPPAGKEAAAWAGKMGGMYHWAKGRPGIALRPRAEDGSWAGVYRVVLSRSYLEQMEETS